MPNEPKKDSIDGDFPDKNPKDPTISRRKISEKLQVADSPTKRPPPTLKEVPGEKGETGIAALPKSKANPSATKYRRKLEEDKTGKEELPSRTRLKPSQDRIPFAPRPSGPGLDEPREKKEPDLISMEAGDTSKEENAPIPSSDTAQDTELESDTLLEKTQKILDANHSFFQSGLGRTMLLLAVVIVLILGATLFWKTAWTFGKRFGLQHAEDQKVAIEKRKAAAATAEAFALVDSALLSFQQGDAEKAILLLDKIRELSPDFPSLEYLSGLAALQSGQPEKAEDRAIKSVGKGERVSDSLALMAIARAQSRNVDGGMSMTDEPDAPLALLRQAMKTDPSAAAPRLETANYFRSIGKNQEALSEIGAAKLRMHPFDLLLVAEVTEALIEVDLHGLDGAHVASPRPGDWASLFQASLIAMKRDDFATALQYLDDCRQGLPPSTFQYLINDPSLRKFAFHPKARELFQQFE